MFWNSQNVNVNNKKRHSYYTLNEWSKSLRIQSQNANKWYNQVFKGHWGIQTKTNGTWS